MEEGDHLAVVHQGRLAGRGRVEVAQQYRRGQLVALGCGPARLHAEARRVGVLIVARVQVEVKPSDELAVALHLKHAGILVPHRGAFHLRELQGKQGLRGLEQAVYHVVHLEVLLHLFGVELVLVLHQQVVVKPSFPGRHRLHAGVFQVGALHGQQLVEVLLAFGLHPVHQLGFEGPHRFGVFHHAAAGLVGGVGFVAQQLGFFLPLDEQLLQHGQVGVGRTVVIQRVQLLAQRFRLRILHERAVGRAVQVDAVGRALTRAALAVVIRQAFHIGLVHQQIALILGNVGPEGQAQVAYFVVELLQLLPLFSREGEAVTLVFLHRFGQKFLARSGQGLGFFGFRIVLHGPVELLVQLQLVAVLADDGNAAPRLVAHRRIGAGVEQDADGAGHAAKLVVQRVQRQHGVGKRALGRRHFVNGREGRLGVADGQAGGLLHIRLGGFAEGDGPVERRHQRVGRRRGASRGSIERAYRNQQQRASANYAAQVGTGHG